MFCDMKTNILGCRQDEPPFCAAACPFGLNVKDFTEKAGRGSFDFAYKAYRNAVGFPEIVSKLCPAPCLRACFLGRIGASIQMPLLEKAACDYAKKKEPTDYNIPAKDSRIAVIGGGISGLACALRLAEKRYQVTVFEASDRIGGTLWQLIPDGSFMEDIQRQLKFTQIEFLLNSLIEDIQALDYDAYYIATGQGGHDFGFLHEPAGGYVLGGSLLGVDKMTAIAQGLRAVNPLEWWLKTKTIKGIDGIAPTNLVLEDSLLPETSKTEPSSPGGYTEEEAREEAKRCFACSCDYCVRKCDLMQYYRRQPKRLAGEVDVTVYPKNVDGAGNMQRKLIASCNQCGSCKEACPVALDFQDYLLSSRRIMQEKASLPWAFHDFWLREFAHATGDSAALALAPKAVDKPEYVFFPGCQLGASDPRYIEKAYALILAEYPKTALYLNCCGAPPYWAGKEAQFQESSAKIKAQWQAWNRPVFIFTCPTCRRIFDESLPEIEGIFFYELEAVKNLPNPGKVLDRAAIFDPCASRRYPELQQAVRDVLSKLGQDFQELPNSREDARCCSWGGHGAIADPGYNSFVKEKAIGQSQLPYIAYCANCRDIFASAGKPAWHILDLIFDLNDPDRPAPYWTKRQQNREKLRNSMLKTYWPDLAGEEREMEPKLKIIIEDGLRRKLSDSYILEKEIAQTIAYSETEGQRITQPDTGHIFGHLRIGYLTYWVEYQPIDDGFQLINAYSHRMTIEGDE